MAPSAGANASNVRVMIRVRPLLPRELLHPSECVETDVLKVKTRAPLASDPV